MSKLGSDGFDAAFATLYPRARGVAERILGSVAEAEDVAAEAMARALVRWDHVGRLPYRDAWVLRVTANVAIDAARRRRISSGVNDPERIADLDDATVLRLTLIPALRALPTRQREALVLRHMAGLSEHDVAAALGVSQNTAKKHLQRGMARLRSNLAWEELRIAFD